MLRSLFAPAALAVSLALLSSLGLACGGADAPVAPPAPIIEPPVTPPVTPPVDEEEPPVVVPPVDPPPPVLTELEKPFVLPALQTSVPDYALELPEAELEKFYVDTQSPEVDATFIHAGVRYPVKLRLRGASAREFPKKSWNVDFGEGSFDKRGSLNLVAEYSDASMMAEKIAYDLLAAMRAPAPVAKFVNLTINGRYEGVFVDLEQVSKKFLKAHSFTDEDATIYRCGWKDCEFKPRSQKVGYQKEWNKKTNETSSDAPLDAVLEVINRTPEPQFAAALARSLDVESFLRSMVMDTLAGNSWTEDSESYFIHDRAENKWVYVPWDLNNADSRWWYPNPVGNKPPVTHPLYNFTAIDAVMNQRYAARKDLYAGYLPVFSNLATRVIFNLELRAKLEQRLDKALAEIYTPELLHSRIDAMHALIDADMQRDPYMSDTARDQNGNLHHGYQKFVASRKFLKDFVTLRRGFIATDRKRLSENASPLVLWAVNPAEDWVEIRNVSALPVSTFRDTSGGPVGMTLSASLRQPFAMTLAALTLAPGETIRVPLTMAEGGEVGLFDGATFAGAQDLLFYGALPPGQIYARSIAAPHRWEVRPSGTP